MERERGQEKEMEKQRKRDREERKTERVSRLSDWPELGQASSRPDNSIQGPSRIQRPLSHVLTSCPINSLLADTGTGPKETRA